MQRTLVEHLINFFIEGTRPIRAIEGIILIISSLVSAYFSFFYDSFWIFLISSIIFAAIILLARIHLKGCRGIYEMYHIELEALTNNPKIIHRLMIKIIKFFEEVMLLSAAIVLISLFLEFFYSFNFPLIKPFIASIALAYSFLSMIGHTSRLYAYRELKAIKSKGNLSF